VTGKAVRSDLKNIRFQYKDTPFKVSNTLHVVEVEYEPGSQIQFSPFDATSRYTLLQFHFHAPSEHRINGQLADAELHPVHQNALGELAVVGVLLKIDNKNANPLFDQIMSGAPVGVAASTENNLGGEINAKDLLPKGKSSYYTYTGSLTTPPCTEGVNWYVLSNTGAISSAAVSQYHQIISLFPNYNFVPQQQSSHSRP
jgi:carbonic anhydrase